MATVEVTPTEWQYVSFDADAIAAIASRLADQLGLDRPLRIEVDETSPLGGARVTSLDPVVVQVEGGAFEDPKKPRHLSDRGTADVLGRLLHRVRDRLDPAFGDAPADQELTLPQSVAWDAYSVGRLGRLGYQVQRQRRLYHFRNRHGFNDVADAVFERLWNAEGLTWADLEAACAETAAARDVA